LALVLSLVFPLSSAYANNPIPGVGIVVKKCKCVTCCSTARLSLPGGFFGPGSAPFDGPVALEGNSLGNPDGRIDYAADAMTGPFEMSMQRMKFFTSEPIQLSAAGGISSYDVQWDFSGPGPDADDPIPGVVTLHSGDVLTAGQFKDVLDSSLDGHCVITFYDHTTGAAAGTPIEMDLHLTLQDVGLPVALVADGTPTGSMVLGSDGASAVTFTFASANDELVIQLQSLYGQGPVAAQPSTWGAVKAIYR
jgi:hypothetical protein